MGLIAKIKTSQEPGSALGALGFYINSGYCTSWPTRLILAGRGLLLGACLAGAAAASPFLGRSHPQVTHRPSPFLVKPYLQLGRLPAPDALTLVWHGPDQTGPWMVQVRPLHTWGWGQQIAATGVRVAVPTVAPHRVYQTVLRPLTPGSRFEYRILLRGRLVFQAEAGAPKAPGDSVRVAVAGDLATGGPGPIAIACALARQKPDLVVIPGDMVYQDGRISEYRRHFFPVYNADKADSAVGAPLMRSTLFVGVLGNHDVGERGPKHPFAVDPDSFAYYLYWNQPLNGPILTAPATLAPPLHPQPGWNWQDFRAAAGERFPTMGTFSFDSGPVHWTVLDSNPHVRWETPALRAWLTQDLQAAHKAKWRFVVFHHPAFNFADANLYREQWMSQLWPLLEAHKVDLVFAGHVHTYARSQPLRFTPAADAAAGRDPITQQGPLGGEVTWDAAFDGKVRTRATGILHVITGGGGAHLHVAGKGHLMPLKPYVRIHLPDEHSFSLLDIQDDQVRFRQLTDQGKEIDRFTLTR